MHIAVILGNRMCDDRSLSPLCRKRLEIFKRADLLFHFDRVILSGGVANKKAGISEAEAMFNALVSDGFEPERFVLEDASRSTKENARFSVPLAASLHADELTVLTSAEHFERSYLNPITLFKKELDAYPDIRLSLFGE